MSSTEPSYNVDHYYEQIKQLRFNAFNSKPHMVDETCVHVVVSLGTRGFYRTSVDHQDIADLTAHGDCMILDIEKADSGQVIRRLRASSVKSGSISAGQREHPDRLGQFRITHRFHEDRSLTLQGMIKDRYEPRAYIFRDATKPEYSQSELEEILRRVRHETSTSHTPFTSLRNLYIPVTSLTLEHRRADLEALEAMFKASQVSTLKAVISTTAASSHDIDDTRVIIVTEPHTVTYQYKKDMQSTGLLNKRGDYTILERELDRTSQTITARSLLAANGNDGGKVRQAERHNNFLGTYRYWSRSGRKSNVRSEDVEYGKIVVASSPIAFIYDDHRNTDAEPLTVEDCTRIIRSARGARQNQRTDAGWGTHQFSLDVLGSDLTAAITD
jgi:hypothetical protein